MYIQQTNTHTQTHMQHAHKHMQCTHTHKIYIQTRLQMNILYSYTQAYTILSKCIQKLTIIH